MNSFSSRSTLRVGQQEYEIYRLDAVEKAGLQPPEEFEDDPRRWNWDTRCC